MKKNVNFWVLSCLLAVLLISCSKTEEFEYVDTVQVKTIFSYRNMDQKFHVMIYERNNNVNRVELNPDQACYFQEFREGEEAFLYKRGDKYYVSSKKITSENMEK